jgi:hypothetical protein
VPPPLYRVVNQGDLRVNKDEADEINLADLDNRN